MRLEAGWLLKIKHKQKHSEDWKIGCALELLSERDVLSLREDA